MGTRATLTHAYGAKYGTGAALPLFVKMTARQALNFKVTKSPDPAGMFPDIGFQVAKDTHPNGKKEGIRPVDQCVPGVDHCDPMMVRGFDGSKFPTELFGHELGTSEYSVGKLATMWVSSFNQVTMRNTGMPNKKTWEGVEFHRWVVDEVHDRRENCDGNPEEGSTGLDCDSPLGAWTAQPWYMEPRPPFYNSHVGFEIPEESLYVIDGSDEKVTCGNVTCHPGSVVLTRFNKTAMYDEKKSSYDPSERVIFVSKVPVDPKIYLDTEPNTGTVIRGSMPVQRNIRVKPSILFPDIMDMLIPVLVIHESASATEAQRAVLKQLQSATRMERPSGMVMMMVIMGWLFLSTGLLMIVWRAPTHMSGVGKGQHQQHQEIPLSPTSTLASNGKEDVVFC